MSIVSPGTRTRNPYPGMLDFWPATENIYTAQPASTMATSGKFR
ncbi:hypothetical protein AB1L42_18630 [Thalassoglobus sp. JC818]